MSVVSLRSATTSSPAAWLSEVTSMGIEYQIYRDKWCTVSYEEYVEFPGKKRIKPKGISMGFYIATGMLLSLR